MSEKLLFTASSLLYKTVEKINELNGFTIQRFGATGKTPFDLQVDNGEIDVKRYVSVNASEMDNIDFSEAIDLTEQELRTARAEDSVLADKILQEVNKRMDDVAKLMANMRCYDVLLKMRDIRPLEHSHNQWKTVKEDFLETETGIVTNAVYQFSYRHSNETGYGSHNKNGAWYLTWSLTIRSANPEKYPVELAGQMRKRFTSKEDMLKYLEGRKKKFEDCFEEDFPPVPKKYKQLFSYAGMLLPGYSIKEEAKN